jgi:hypothetical protein
MADDGCGDFRRRDTAQSLIRLRCREELL